MGYVASNSRMVVNDDSENMWREEVMAYFKVPSENLPRGTENNNRDLSQDNQSVGQSCPRTSQI
jgi:hypothetical protein